MKITVLLGGSSEERNVSLSSGAAVSRALREAGHEVLAWDTLRGPLSPAEEAGILDHGIGAVPPVHGESDIIDRGNLAPLLDASENRDTDLYFPILHGGAGEDGRLQTLLELAGVPFAGSGRVGCMLAMDKELSKRLFRDAGIPTPDWAVVDGALPGPDLRRAAEKAMERLGLPLIVKPPSGGSTVGLTLVRDPADLQGAVELSSRYERRVLLERFVSGREMTVGILDREALEVGEIIPSHELFDYECKYQPGLAQEIFPADVTPGIRERLRTLALQVHELLRLADFSRVDFILDREGTPWVLEANSLPGMSPASLLPQSAAASGLTFPELCDGIARAAIRRNSGQ